MLATLKMPKILTCYKHFQIFVLGMYSGMPLAVIYVSLAAWFTDYNVDLAIITSFALSRAFYSLKVFWAPAINHIEIPIIGKIGHRKSWMLFCTGIITFILFLMSRADPTNNISYIFTLAIILGIASSTFDIVFDAFRIENIAQDEQTIAASSVIFGYRIGMLIAGFGMLRIADKYDWNTAFLTLSFLHFLCMLFIFKTEEPKINRGKVSWLFFIPTLIVVCVGLAFGKLVAALVFVVITIAYFIFLNNYRNTTTEYKGNINKFIMDWETGVINPFKDFFSKDYSLLILAAIILYKLGDAFLGVVATPFYMELGYTKTQIADIAKLYGLIATIIGSYFGGYLMHQLGNIKGLIICGIAQSVTNIAFIWLNHVEPTSFSLSIAISIENIAGGMGTAALVGYLSNLCNRQYSATQYALFSSASGLASHSIVAFGGAIEKAIGWDQYFLMTVFLGFPAVILLFWLNKKINKTETLEKKN